MIISSLLQIELYSIVAKIDENLAFRMVKYTNKYASTTAEINKVQAKVITEAQKYKYTTVLGSSKTVPKEKVMSLQKQ